MGGSPLPWFNPWFFSVCGTISLPVGFQGIKMPRVFILKINFYPGRCYKNGPCSSVPINIALQDYGNHMHRPATAVAFYHNDRGDHILPVSFRQSIPVAWFRTTFTHTKYRFIIYFK